MDVQNLLMKRGLDFIFCNRHNVKYLVLQCLCLQDVHLGRVQGSGHGVQRGWAGGGGLCDARGPRALLTPQPDLLSQGSARGAGRQSDRVRRTARESNLDRPLFNRGCTVFPIRQSASVVPEFLQC